MANEQIKARGNGAQNDKDSILVEAKKLLAVLHAALPNIPKVHRQLSAYSHMVHAALTLIEEFHLAREYKEDRVLHQKRMIAQYAVISAMLEECDSLGYITKSDELKICQILDRMDEGIRRWKSATLSPKNQEHSFGIRAAIKYNLKNLKSYETRRKNRAHQCSTNHHSRPQVETNGNRLHRCEDCRG